VELYLQPPLRLHGVVLNKAQGQLYLYLCTLHFYVNRVILLLSRIVDGGDVIQMRPHC